MLSALRRLAQSIRHAPGLKRLDLLWDWMRPKYLSIIGLAARHQGLGISVGGHDLRLHPIFATCGWETVELESYRLFVNLLRPGDVIVDVGAHIGTYTLIALQHIGPQGRVIAYEPHDAARRYLKMHLEWNGGGERVTIRDVCCGAQAGQTDFYFNPGHEIAEGMNGRVPVEGFSAQKVPMVTLDEEMAKLVKPPTLIKIDIEGGEWDALRGAEATLRKLRPLLLLSLHPPALAKVGVTPEQVLKWLKDHHYDPQVFAQDHEIHVLARSK